jgi:hypothetical protein
MDKIRNTIAKKAAGRQPKLNYEKIFYRTFLLTPALSEGEGATERLD